ncbi:hypothetical protein UlMin_013414 [Ulmus minor]
MKSNAGNPTEEDAMLNCISQILLEEDLEDGTCGFPDDTLQAAAKSFYDVVDVRSQYYSDTRCCNCHGSDSSVAVNNLCQICFINDAVRVHDSYHIPALPVYNSQLGSQLSLNPSGYGYYAHQLSSCYNANEMILDFQNKQLIPLKPNGKSHYSQTEARKRKNYSYKLVKESERSNKHLEVYSVEDSDLSETFDMALSSDGWDCDYTNCTLALHNHQERKLDQSSRQAKGSAAEGTRRGRKKWDDDEDLLDFKTLLTNCAEFVAANDRERAIELLYQIRRSSSPSSSGSQRLAYHFAIALEARLDGVGNEVYAGLAAKSISLLTYLKSIRLFLSVSPFMKTSYFYANQTILKLAEKATTLHIVHFGILFGFQWPSFIQRLSSRPGGPPLLRITGIDLPQTGFQPAARLEETGHRLANYCKRFNVPFEYNSIAQRWESVSYEDLKINKDEVNVVNCLYRFRYLPDDTAGSKSSRDTVLSLIKRINPDIFIHGIANGAYNSPFFMSRFKEALYFFSAMFDMIEANAPHELEEDRMFLEQEMYGKEIFNVIACEGSKRIERPEIYKQWQARNLRAGLRQLPLDQEIMKKVKVQMKLCYHKDFLVGEDSQWIVQGWKGRILYALSCWKPA